MNAATLSRADIAARIPHAGSMCLLDAVSAWDDTTIHARAVSHRDPANPLREAAGLLAPCVIEYAAQAMAVHGGLIAERAAGGAQPPRAGMLASVRGVKLNVARLDDLAEPLEIEATRLSGEGNSVLYGFSVRAGSREVASGRAAVVLDAGDLFGAHV